MNEGNNIYVVIPAKDEEKRIGPVLTATFRQGFHNVIVVDDGSIDNTSAVARELGAHVLHHRINLGPGAATQTGIEYAWELGADAVITMDGDGQHFPQDIIILVRELRESNADIVIGSRFKKRSNEIPWSRRVYNFVGNIITFLATGIYVSDSQSGMKAIARSVSDKMKLHLNGYAFCTEIIMFIKEYNLKYTEVPISVLYTDETMSKGQNFLHGVRMLFDFFKRFIFLS